LTERTLCAALFAKIQEAIDIEEGLRCFASLAIWNI